MHQVQAVKKTVATVTQEESDRLQQIVTEKQAASEVVNDAITHCRNLVAQSARQSNQWWKEMSAKYGFNVQSNLGFSSDDNSIFELVDPDEEILRAANSDDAAQ